MLPFPRTTKKRSVLRANRAMLLKHVPKRMMQDEELETGQKPLENGELGKIKKDAQ